MLLLLLALVAAKQVDLVKDPWMHDLTYWREDPSTLICRASSIPSLGPSVVDGLFALCVSQPWSSDFCTLATEIQLPSGVDQVNLTVAVQVGDQGLFSLQASFQGFSWTWSASELSQNVYKNVSILIDVPTFVDETLKLTFGSMRGKGDFISVNEVHLFAKVSDSLSTLSIAVIVVGTLLFLMMLGWILICYRRHRQARFQ